MGVRHAAIPAKAGRSEFQASQGYIVTLFLRIILGRGGGRGGKWYLETWLRIKALLLLQRTWVQIPAPT